MNMLIYIKQQTSLAVTYAEDGAYASAARVLREAAERLQTHAEQRAAELEKLIAPALNHHGEPIACGTSRVPITPADDISTQYRGAPMGVANYTAPDVTPQDALHFGVRRVVIDKQGYSRDGVYWGLGVPLWHAATDGNGCLASRWFRAMDYKAAAQIVRDEFPHATVQRVPS